jgi:Ser-Thr-rich glycosyl-phosphatidyl-inositol-anchored membrane family
MKRTLFICVIVGMLACGQAAAQSITVTKPAANDTWLKGSSYTITWTNQGQVGPSVVITLRNSADTTDVLSIVPHQQNVGSYPWPVPLSVAAGTYRVRVRASSVIGTSAMFNIAEPPSGPIKVTAPNGGESWALGSSKQITWNPGAATGNVRIDLYRNGTAPANKVGVIAPSVAATAGTYAWTVGAYQGGTAPDGDGYRVMVSSTSPVLQDASDNPFTIIAQGQSGGFHAQPGQLAPAFVELHILEPTKDSRWTIGMPGVVRWNAAADVKFPLWVFLVAADTKLPIDDMGQIGSDGYHPSQMQWTVADNLYDGQYRVRLTSADKKVVAHSQPFTIVATTYRTVTAPVSEVGNQYKWHNWTSYTDWGEGAPFTTAHLTAVPDPGGNTIKYGYQRWYEDDGNHGWILHRSFVRFNLSAIIATLKGRTTVKSAAITWSAAPGSPQTCDGTVLGLEAALPGLNSMFGDAFTNFPMRLLAPNGDPSAVNQLVQQWLDDPQRNYGTIFDVPNKGQLQENGQCVEFANAVLKIQIEEKLTK